MRNPRLLLPLIGIMFVLVVIVTGTTIYLLYTAAFETERRRLVDAAQHNVNLIQSLAALDGFQGGEISAAERERIVETVVEQYQRFQLEGFGRTGNLMLGRLSGDDIVTLLHQRMNERPVPVPVPFASRRAIPMRQALLGKSGSLVGLDHSGEPVLAAYLPLPELGLGIVAKMNVAEIRAPYLRAGLVAAAVAVVVKLLGAALFFRITNPFLRRLQESEARSREVVETAADAIIVVDDRGAIEALNPAGQRLFGYPPDRHLRVGIDRLLPGVFAPREEEPDRGTPLLIHDAMRRAPWREVTGVRQDGTRFPAEVSFRETIVQGRQRFTAVCRDIALRKEAERQVLLAKEEAERSNLAKTDFMAMISHELRTPMNGVLGMNSLLLSTSLDPEQQRFAEAVRTSGETLLTIINDILDYSKIEAGMFELEQADFAIHALVAGVLDLLQIQAGAKGVELTAFIDPALPALLRGDPGRIKQVLVNLVGNAVKFTEVGCVAVEVGLQQRTQDDVLLRCEVSDTGIGIPHGVGPRLFERFTQVDPSTTRRYGGTGLGLAIAKEITGLMGGEIGYDSTPAHGSRFWFTARLCCPPAAEQPAGPELSALDGRRALLVERSELNRTLLGKQLAALGLQVCAAENGATAIRLFAAAAQQGTPLDVVLANRNLPDMDGTDLLRGLRRMSGGAECRTVLMASMSERNGVAPCGVEPISRVVAKPVHQSDLRDALLGLFAAPAAGGSGAAAGPPTPRNPPLRVLLADDNPVNQLLAAAYLKKMGHIVDVVSNGQDAVAAAEDQLYDLILMDIHMPDIDGLEAAQRIRVRPAGERGDVPIIAMTADVARGDRERFLAAGMNDHLAKPFDYEVLDEMVKRWAGQRVSSLHDPGPRRPTDDA